MSVMGLFSIDRGMLLVIIGETLTYLIILIEFKNDDSSSMEGYNFNGTGNGEGGIFNGTTGEAGFSTEQSFLL